MRSDAKQPSRLAMWRGGEAAYLVIALCLFPLAIGGYWAYGNLVSDISFIANVCTFTLNYC